MVEYVLRVCIEDVLSEPVDIFHTLFTLEAGIIHWYMAVLIYIVHIFVLRELLSVENTCISIMGV